MQLSISLLATVLASISQISASPTPTSPRTTVKQSTREELVRRLENKHVQRRAVPLPSNMGYPTCEDAGSGGELFAILSNTNMANGDYIGSITGGVANRDDCNVACAQNGLCVVAESFGPNGGPYYCNLYSSIGDLSSGFNPLAIRGSCADAIAASGYSNADSTCCQKYYSAGIP